MNRKRAIFEIIMDQLKNIYQIAHAQPQGINKSSLILGVELIFETYLPKKPLLIFSREDSFLPATID